MFSLEQLLFQQHVGRHHGSTVQDDNNNIFIEDNEPMSSLVLKKIYQISRLYVVQLPVHLIDFCRFRIPGLL